ncbi:MAG: ABC transporter substrate-binding protein [Actinomycetota bacterium]|nr:ABC transporter substrate-binding protein [Actinomycetota bacterium]
MKVRLPFRRSGDHYRISPAWLTLAVLSGVAIAASAVVVAPPKKPTSSVVREVTQSGGKLGSVAPVDSSSPNDLQKTSVLPPAPASFQCAAGRNGGATDVGVTGSEIKLGATIVNTGIGASFLHDARYGMTAVANAVNRTGGVCGRKLSLLLKDDGWKFDLGGDYIRNLVEDKKVFALAVVPSSEGLQNVSNAGYLKKKGVPVVGSDGMLIHQYLDPYIWPVAASTMSAMHIMVQQAYDAGARHFGIVYESTYHFGLEGAVAFNAAVKRVTHAEVPGFSNPFKNAQCKERFCGIANSQVSYGPQIQVFNNACLSAPKCDFVALLLEPATAISWLTAGALSPSDGIRMGGPQPLFTRSFAQQCGTRCNGLWLWTGYNPPIGANLGRRAVSDYVNAMQTGSSADFTNTFVEGAYLGMTMMVKALQDVGPQLTRERLIAVLNNMTLDTGLTPPLSWRAGDHFANTRMQAWSIQYKDRFSGWRDERVELEDLDAGKDIPT